MMNIKEFRRSMPEVPHKDGLASWSREHFANQVNLHVDKKYHITKNIISMIEDNYSFMGKLHESIGPAIKKVMDDGKSS